MVKQQLLDLFKAYDLPTQRVIKAVLILEQENISLKQPHLREEINDIISRVAKTKLTEEQEAEGEKGENQ